MGVTSWRVFYPRRDLISELRARFTCVVIWINLIIFAINLNTKVSLLKSYDSEENDEVVERFKIEQINTESNLFQRKLKTFK